MGAKLYNMNDEVQVSPSSFLRGARNRTQAKANQDWIEVAKTQLTTNFKTVFETTSQS